MVYTSISGVQVPDATDGFNPPAQFKTWVDKASEYDYYLPVADLTERNALAAPELREGLLVAVKSENALYYYTGAGWSEVWQDSNQTVNISNFGANWTAGTGAQVPRIVRQGNICNLYGAVTFGTGASTNNILTIPLALQPTTGGLRFIGTSVAGNGAQGVLRLDSGVLQFGHNTANLVVTNVLPLIGSWVLD